MRLQKHPSKALHDNRPKLFVIEHLEPKLSEWLYLEYSHAAELVRQGNLLITNVKRRNERRRLRRICGVRRESVTDLFSQQKLLILDPQARKKLTPADLEKWHVVVVGGILGDDPPRGRTRELLTRFLPKAASRNLGKLQLSIDGSVYLARLVSEGTQLDQIPLIHNLEIPVGPRCSIVLPFAYPLVRGKPLISSRLVAYLKRQGTKF
jgi:ribosome biogenesis SPOUT family RNA methylase Rps3